jgi:hypothetical protein
MLRIFNNLRRKNKFDRMLIEFIEQKKMNVMEEQAKSLITTHSQVLMVHHG